MSIKGTVVKKGSFISIVIGDLVPYGIAEFHRGYESIVFYPNVGNIEIDETDIFFYQDTFLSVINGEVSEISDVTNIEGDS